MKPTPLEYRQLKEMDERLMRLKEARFNEFGHPDPRGMFILVHIFSIPVIGWGLLLIGLLWEWSSKFARMCWIVAKAGYFYATKSLRK